MYLFHFYLKQLHRRLRPASVRRGAAANGGIVEESGLRGQGPPPQDTAGGWHVDTNSLQNSCQPP
jgi:hypothetical protein